MDEARALVGGWFRSQAEWCERLGSPLYARLLTRLADDVGRSGASWAVLRELAGDPADSAPALRFMGAVHRLVIEGKATELARYYPSSGGTETGDPWPAFIATIEENATELKHSLHRPVQTNEVGRAAALVCGFLTVARTTGSPLRMLEAGASAGLNLRWDHFLYEARGQKWGPEDSPVRLCDFNSDHALPFEASATVVERAGCDINPLDVTTDEGRVTLMSYVWPDQVQRIRLLKGAIAVARDLPVPLEQASAPSWVSERLQELPDGLTTVVFHSIFFQYMSQDERDSFVAAIEDAGARASEGNPLAWVRFEPGGQQAETRVKLWPGGQDRLVGTSSFHGAGVRYLG